MPADEVCGFTMDALIHRNVGNKPEPWPQLTRFRYDIATGAYRTQAGATLDDGSAARAVMQVFQLLLALELRRLVFCDLSADNILFDHKSHKPGLIDTDSFKHQNNESSSLGTPGFVDPRLLDLGRSGAGGYHFDSKSDVYAASVLAHLVLVGVMPHSVPTNPDMRDDDKARRRLTWARWLAQGETPFRAAGCEVIPNELTRLVRRRHNHLRVAAGRSTDLRMVLDHLHGTFAVGSRENPILALDTQDPRSPHAQRLRKMGHTRMMADLRQKYAMTVTVRRTTVAPKQPQPDPTHLRGFLEERGIRLPQQQGQP